MSDTKVIVIIVKKGGTGIGAVVLLLLALFAIKKCSGCDVAGDALDNANKRLKQDRPIEKFLDQVGQPANQGNATPGRQAAPPPTWRGPAKAPVPACACLKSDMECQYQHCGLPRPAEQPRAAPYVCPAARQQCHPSDDPSCVKRVCL